MLSLNPKELKLSKLHHYLLGAVVPRPICFASTIDENGRPNLAPFSFSMSLALILQLQFFHHLEVEEQVNTKIPITIFKRLRGCY